MLILNLCPHAMIAVSQSDMADGQLSFSEALGGDDEKIRTIAILPHRSNALSQRISSVLAASYVDADIREAIRNLDAKHTQNSPGIRRRLRLDVQKEMIDCNGGIISEFGHVAEVCPSAQIAERLQLRHYQAIRAHRLCYSKSP
jgi:hypothetical protein